MHVCNRRRDDAEKNDYYATDPKAVEILLKNENFAHNIWEKGFKGDPIIKWVN